MGGFVLVDGIDGSGKGVVMSAFRKWAEEKNLKILDLIDYCKKKKTLPEPEEIKYYDAIFSTEPSYAYIGRAISEEIIFDNKRDYSVISTAWAFALDREILYNRIIIPAIKQNKFIFQERGIVTSIVYQPVQGRISLKEIFDMPGNRLALKYSPNILLITKVEPKVVIERLQREGRLEGAIFIKLNFQRKVDERYSSLWLKNLFERFKAKVIYLDTNPPKSVEETKKEAIKIWEEFLKEIKN